MTATVSPSTASTHPAPASAEADALAGGGAVAAGDLRAHAREERPTWQAIRKGWRRKCPNCGTGPLLSGYLKVRRACQVCDEQLYHHRADDGPAYLTILIVGHLMAPLLHVVFVTWRPEPLVMFTIFAVGCCALSLYLLPRLKGVIVAVQWSRYMHGFARAA